MTRIMGVDPGLTRCGVGIIDAGKSREVKLVSVQTITSSPDSALASRIGELGIALEALILELKPNRIAIERVFSQQNLRTVMGTAQISGVVLYLANKHNLPVSLHTPTEVKAAVTGSGKAAKAQVGVMVARILNLEEVPKPADSADSLAIAICNAWKIGSGTATEPITRAQMQWNSAVAAPKKKGWV